MFNKTTLALIIASSATLFVACNNSDNPAENANNNSNTPVTNEAVKANYILMAHAAYTDALSTAQVLQTSINTFINAPTEANLSAAKAAYKVSRTPYQQSEIMRWDSVVTTGKNLAADGGPSSVDDWEGQVNAWPLDENHIVDIIEDATTYPTINTTLLIAQNGAGNNEANVTTGIHAVEFMLWGEDTNGTLAGAGQRPALDFDVTNCQDTYCQRRADYLKAATDLLISDLTEMQAQWIPSAVTTAGTLSYNFNNSDLAMDYILGSITAMATDELAVARMNSGLTLGDPEEEHDCFSDLSHIAIHANFVGVTNAFYGEYKSDNTNIKGAGIGDLIKAQDENTYQKIDAAFKSIKSDMDQIVEFGEKAVNPIKFDQIIGQAATAPERMVTQNAIDTLIGLEAELKTAAMLLSLNPIDTSGSGD